MMAAQVLKQLALHTMKRQNSCIIAQCLGAHPGLPTAATQPPLSPPAWRSPLHPQARAFSTAQDAEEAKQKNKPEPAFSNTGRKISDRIIRVLDEAGNDLGHMHRADVIRLMDQRGLLLVKRNASTEPPEYQLMTGQQIHEERLRLRERNKAQPKAGPTLTKELTFSSNIGQHDLDTKSKQIQQWIEKKYQVQITVKKGKQADEPADRSEAIFNHILQTMPGEATFSSKPQAVRGGKATMCVLRPLTPKEKAAHQESQGAQRGTS
ncbi:translation initiation factor IF-3, mitochondrial [Tenrec ecaudatus]|uniref:translation initiation factor IF-3, mitochondrial n=1 Tax=Tenrec ecaudatus TaxID=94439 RepID=UPI003F5AD45C